MILVVKEEKRIKELLGLDKLWENMLEDGSAKEPNPAHWYLAILDKSEIAGIGIVQWLGNNLITWHFGLREKFRGEGSVEYGQEAIRFMEEYQPGLQQITMVPGDKHKAKAYALKVGFKQEYTIPKCVFKDGRLYNKYIMRIPHNGRF